MNTRLILIIAAVVLVLAAVAAIFIPIVASRNNGTLNLTVIPNDATVKIDGKQVGGVNIGLSSGDHLVVVSRDGFANQVLPLTIKPGQTLTKSLVLVANSTVGQDWAANNPDQVAQAEGITGKQIAEGGAIALDKHKIIELLPYKGADFSISYGASQLHAGDPTAAAIYVTAATQDGQNRADRWITAQGYTPSDFEIIRQGLSDGD